MRFVAAIVLLVGVAHAQPRMRPFMPAPGISVGGRITAVGFCSTAQRAVALLQNGDVVAIDAAGVIHPIGNAGPSLGPIACDRKNRVTVVKPAAIVTFDGSSRRSTKIPASQMRIIRVLDDDTIGLVDLSGVVYRFDGKALETAWKSKHSFAHDSAELDGTGRRLLSQVGNKIIVHDRTGIVEGPPGIRAVWLDNTSVLCIDGIGAVSRWVVGTATDKPELVHQLPAGRDLFARTMMHRAGSRVVIQQFDAPLVTLELDTAGKLVAFSTISRLPVALRVAAGAAPFAVLATIDRAVIVDLRKSSAAIPHDQPIMIVGAMAFSPDGKKLAMLGGERDILVAALDRSSVTRLRAPRTGFPRGPLRWAPDGTLVGGLVGQIRFNPDGTTDVVSTSRAQGFTDDGDPIALSRQGHIVIERRHGQQSFAFDSRFGLVEAHATERYLAARSGRRIDIYALGAAADAVPIFRTPERNLLRAGVLVGDAGAVMYVDDDGTIYLATPTGETVLAKIDGFPHMLASPDRQRVAIGAGNSVQIWDATGMRVAQFLAGGRIVALAWSPDLRTLAVATDAGIELWTIPRP